MTSGKKGVQNTLLEMSRVLKNEGIIEIAIQIEGTEPSDKIYWEVWNKIGLNSVFHPPSFYIDILEGAGCNLVEQFTIKTKKKMTEDQAKEEIEFACKETLKIFSDFNLEVKPFTEIWAEFQPKIRKYGMGYWPIFLVLIFQKKE
jgi:hypothetical protein